MARTGSLSRVLLLSTLCGTSAPVPGAAVAGAAALAPGFQAGVAAGVAAAAAYLSSASVSGLSPAEFTRAASFAAQSAAVDAARAAGAASSTIHAAALNALEFSMVQSSVESLRQLLDDLKQQVSDHPWKMTKGELGVAVGDKVREVMTSGGDTIMDELSAPEVLDEMKARLAEMEKITGSKPERDDDVISQMEVMLNGAGMASEDGDMASP